MHKQFLISLAILQAASWPAIASTTTMDEGLPQPQTIIIDQSLPAAQAQGMALAARRYYAFWNTGEEQFAQAALASNFIDRNLPAGRPQGPQGALFASKNFRAAVPDLAVTVEEMLVVGNRVVGRLHFTGHYSGSFQGKQGDGRKVDFIATDIYRIADGQIAENWHLEDNLTLLQQLGAVR